MMNALWSYTAVDLKDGRARRRGELAAGSAAEVRASLRRIGLQVIELRQHRSTHFGVNGRLASARLDRIVRAVASRWHQHLRTRRRAHRAELFDGLSTMLESGLPLLEAVETLLRSTHARKRLNPARRMLVDLREQLRGGASLDDAMSAHPTWFDGTEVAMMRAAQHAGNLPPVLRRLALQHEQAGALGQKLASALAYPSVIALVGIGVVIFLSIKTLPDLSGILRSASLEVPALTEHVMSAGQLLAHWWPVVLLAVAAVLALLWVFPLVLAGSRWNLTPRVLRRMIVAGFSQRFSDLLKTGVPVVEALRVLAPTVPSTSLRSKLLAAAEQVERGEELSAALSDDRWFDGEYARLLEIGQASGELDVLLERLGRRYERTATRLIDRLASLLEPCVILALAVLIGIVVMAAVLPLTRLQEVLR